MLFRFSTQIFDRGFLLNLIGNDAIRIFRSFIALNSAIEHVNVAVSSSIIHHCFFDEEFMFTRRNIAGFNREKNIENMDETLM